MRYNINGTEVRSENAAKPACFAGRWVLDWMSMLDRRASALDLGCGKLRYTVHLSRLLQSVVAVDSKAQIDRVQKLFGLDCSVREYTARYLPNVSAFAFDEPQWRRSQYSVILCSNVLSAIPLAKARRELLAAAFNLLARGGQFLITTQYRNSHFSRWRADPRATRLLDGFLVRHSRGTSFYGLIDSDELVKSCRKAGFTVTSSGHAEQLAYALATRD